MWALGNIAGDSPECRDIVLAAGIMPHLLALLVMPDIKLTVLINATWTLSNLCRGKNPEPSAEIVSLIQKWSSQINRLCNCSIHGLDDMIS